MSYTQGQGAVLSIGVDGAAASRRDIETVGDALRRLNESNFQKLSGQIGGIQGQFTSLKASVGDIIKVATAAAGIGIVAFTGLIKGALDSAAGLHDMSIQTGASVAALMQFRDIGATSDTTAQTIAGSMNKLAKGMAVASEESKGIGSAVKAIGLDFNALKNMQLDAQMIAVARALDQFQDGAGKSAVAMTLFGKEGAKMLPFLADLAGESDKVTASLTAQEVASKAALAAMADDFGDNMTKIGKASEETKKNISFGMLPALFEASDAFLKVATEAGGLKETIAKLSADGSIAQWTRDAIIGVTYLADTFQVLGRVETAIFKGIKASLTITADSFAALAKSAVLFIRGEYAQSWEAIKSVATQTGVTAKAAAVDIGDMFGEATFGSKIRARMEEVKGIGAAAKEIKKSLNFDAAGSDGSSKAALKAAQDYAALLDKIHGKEAGQAADFQQNIAILYKGYVDGKQSLEDYVKTVEAYIKQQKSSMDIDKEKAKAMGELADFNKRYSEGLEATSKIYAKLIEDATQEADKNEELARTFGMTKSAIEKLELVRLEGQLAQRASTGLTIDEIDTLEKLIEAKKRSATALASVDTMEANKKSFEQMTEDAKRASEQIGQSLTDNIMQGGKSAAQYLRDLFRTLVLRPILSPIGNAVGSALTGMLGMPGTAQAAGSPGGATSLLGTVGNAYSAISGGMTLAGGLGSGFMGSVAGGLSGAGVGSGLTSAAGMAVGEGIAGVVGPQVAGALSSGMSMLAAAAPYLAGAMAVYAVWKSLDTSGTYHTGGASSASAAGVTTVRAESLNFEATRVNAETEKMTAALASGIVGILDSTATAFGKTAGYTAATAFADDTSKDGAWGGLVISKLGEKILDWQDTKTGSWAPKVFADGEAGKAEYLAALSASVRTALDGIGLPSWAQTMLDKVGSGASIEELGKVVDSINATEHALVAMGDKLAGFANLSDGTVSALISAAGGIDALAASASSYYDNFYSDAEKTAGTAKQVGDALAAVGLAMPASHDAFRAQVEAQIALGEAGAPAVAALLKVNGAFAQLNPVMEAAADSAQAAKDALAAAESVRMEQRSLDIQLMTAMGDAEGALAATRKDALAALLSDQARITQQQIWSAEASAAAIAKAAEASAAAMDAMKSAAAAQLSNVDSAFSVLQRVMKSSTDVLSTRIAKEKALSDALRSTLDNMKMPGTEAATRQGAQADIKAALAIARAGGPLPDAAALSKSLSAVSQDASSLFATYQDYQRDFYSTQNDIAALGHLADSSLSVDEQSLNALNDMLSSAQTQIDLLKGIDISGITTAGAMAALQQSIAGAKANPYSGSAAAINSAYLTALGRAPDAAGMEYWQTAAANGNSMADIIASITNSAEAKSRKVPGFAVGGDHAGGWRVVGEDGPELEATGRARIFNAGQTRDMMANIFKGGSSFDMAAESDNLSRSNAELLAAVARLTDEVTQLRKTNSSENYAIARHTLQTSDTLDRATFGGGPMRVVIENE